MHGSAQIAHNAKQSASRCGPWMEQGGRGKTSVPLTRAQPDDGLVAELRVVRKNRRGAEVLEVTEGKRGEQCGHEGGDGEPHG
jgi:hypothetical protein